MRYAYTNCIILDGTKDMEPKTGLAIITDGEIIADIVPAGSIPADCKIIDLANSYIMPGLINLHAHLALDGNPPKIKAKPIDYDKIYKLITSNFIIRYAFKKMTARRAKTELLSGVTTLRAVGGVLDFDAQVRDSINSGKMVGPRILASNAGVSVPNGHFAGLLATKSVLLRKLLLM